MQTECKRTKHRVQALNVATCVHRGPAGLACTCKIMMAFITEPFDLKRDVSRADDSMAVNAAIRRCVRLFGVSPFQAVMSCLNQTPVCAPAVCTHATCVRIHASCKCLQGGLARRHVGWYRREVGVHKASTIQAICMVYGHDEETDDAPACVSGQRGTSTAPARGYR